MLVLKMVFYLLPPYLANASALLMKGKTPLDMHINFLDHKPLFGEGKTFKGTFFGIFSGIVVATTLNTMFPEVIWEVLKVDYPYLGILLAFGAIMGDAVASFIKRRRNMPRGREVFLLDQLDFIIGAMVFGSLIYVPSLIEVGVIIAVTLIAHRASNFLAYNLRLKGVPW